MCAHPKRSPTHTHTHSHSDIRVQVEGQAQEQQVPLSVLSNYSLSVLLSKGIRRCSSRRRSCCRSAPFFFLPSFPNLSLPFPPQTRRQVLTKNISCAAHAADIQSERRIVDSPNLLPAAAPVVERHHRFPAEHSRSLLYRSSLETQSTVCLS